MVGSDIPMQEQNITPIRVDGTTLILIVPILLILLATLSFHKILNLVLGLHDQAAIHIQKYWEGFMNGNRIYIAIWSGIHMIVIS